MSPKCGKSTTGKMRNDSAEKFHKPLPNSTKYPLPIFRIPHFTTAKTRSASSAYRDTNIQKTSLGYFKRQTHFRAGSNTVEETLLGMCIDNDKISSHITNTDGRKQYG